MRVSSLLGILSVSCAALVACEKPTSLALQFPSAAHDFAFTFVSLCGLEADSSACHEAPAAGGDIAIESAPEVEPGSCTIDMTILDSCVLPRLTLLTTSFFEDVHGDVEPTEIGVNPNTFVRAFDDDNDGFSNYLEWAEESDARNPAETPGGNGDLF